MDNMIFTSEVCGVVLIAPFDKISRPPCSTIRFIVFLSLFFRCFSPFSLYHRTFSLTVPVALLINQNRHGNLLVRHGWLSALATGQAQNIHAVCLSNLILGKFLIRSGASSHITSPHSSRSGSCSSLLSITGSCVIS